MNIGGAIVGGGSRGHSDGKNCKIENKKYIIW